MKTTDLCDHYGDQVAVAESIGLQHFGGRTTFAGLIATVRCYEDNSFVRAELERDGNGKVLVVDGGGSLRCALLGDMLAELGQQNGWNGIIIYGAIRDCEAVGAIDIGVMALGTHPRRSAKHQQGSRNQVLHVAGIRWIPGNYIYVDQDGIVCSEYELVLPA